MAAGIEPGAPLNYSLPVEMGDPRWDEVAEHVYASYPNACILFVDEIVNPDLVEAYETQKSILQAKRGADAISERLLFHGTSAASMRSISREGFKVGYSRVAAHGKGTYFAAEARYSFGFMRPDHDDVSYMFLASVLIGPAGTYGSGQQINTSVHDCVGGTSGSIVVTPYDAGALPRFVVGFHKNAR